MECKREFSIAQCRNGPLGIEYIDAEGKPLRARIAGESGRVLRSMAFMRGAGIPATGSWPSCDGVRLDAVGPFDVGLSTSADWDMCAVSPVATKSKLSSASCRRSTGSTARRCIERGRSSSETCRCAFERMFGDPAASRCTRSGAVLRQFVSHLCRVRFDARQWRAAACRIAQALATWPPAAGYLAEFPARWLRRRLGMAEIPKSL